MTKKNLITVITDHQLTADTIASAIIDSSRAAYLAACLKKGVVSLDKYNGDTASILAMEIKATLPSKLAKLRKTYPEAFYYWCKTSELLS